MELKKTKYRLLLAIALNVIFINQNTAIAQSFKSICFSCAKEYIPGSPVGGSQKSLSYLVLFSRDLLSDTDVLYMTDLGLICSEFYDEDDDIKKMLLRKTIPDLMKYSPNKMLEKSFLEDGCIPRKIGNALSPIAHIAAEVPVSRMGHLQAIQSYFAGQGKPEFFKQIINAKNTRGYTTLDYLQFMNDENIYSKEFEDGINIFIRYLCDNGGEYAIFKPTKKCDGQRLIVK